MSEERCPPERHVVSPLWCWMGLRISGLAAAAVLTIAFCMWVYFELRDYAALSCLSSSTQAERRQLVADPHRDPDSLAEGIWCAYANGGTTAGISHLGSGDYLGRLIAS